MSRDIRRPETHAAFPCGSRSLGRRLLIPRRQSYYDALQGVRERGDIDQWLAFLLEGVRVQAIDAVVRAEGLIGLRERYRVTVRAATSGIANQMAELALEQPVLNSRVVDDRLGVSRPAALKTLRQLEALEVLAATAAGSWGQLRWRAG